MILTAVKWVGITYLTWIWLALCIGSARADNGHGHDHHDDGGASSSTNTTTATVNSTTPSSSTSSAQGGTGGTGGVSEADASAYMDTANTSNQSVTVNVTASSQDAATGDGGDLNSTGTNSNGEAGDSQSGGIVSNNESNFFAFSTGFPQASGCFSGTQGGAGSSDGGSGFLGFHWLNADCWMSQLAESERDSEVQALLKCESKKFRNAIGFREPKRSRQEYCVAFMIAKHNAEIDDEKAKMLEALQSGQVRLEQQMAAVTEQVEQVEMGDPSGDLAELRKRQDAQDSRARQRDKSNAALKEELSEFLTVVEETPNE